MQLNGESSCQRRSTVPVDLRLYPRYEEITRWEEFVNKRFPSREIPTNAKQRARFHKGVDPTLLTDPSFRALHEQFHTKIELAIALIAAHSPYGVSSSHNQRQNLLSKL